jgi:hypothetical protein
MTAVQPPITADRSPSPLGALRQLMLADAVFTLVAGIALLLAADPLADEAGLATSGPLLAIGAFFVVLAGVVAAVGRASEDLLPRLVPLNGIGDLGWAAASVIVSLSADLSGSGRALVLVQGVAVLVIGEAKLLLSRRVRSSTKITG